MDRFDIADKVPVCFENMLLKSGAEYKGFLESDAFSPPLMVVVITGFHYVLSDLNRLQHLLQDIFLRGWSPLYLSVEDSA